MKEVKWISTKEKRPKPFKRVWTYKIGDKVRMSWKDKQGNWFYKEDFDSKFSGYGYFPEYWCEFTPPDPPLQEIG